MKLYPDKLGDQIARGLAPVYLLSGDEPLGMMECSDKIRRAAQAAGHDEREVIVANDDNDWAQLKNSADSLSLFAEKRLLELRLPTGKPGRVGGAALKDYAADPPQDIILLITSARFERAQTNSAWYKAIDKAGVSMTFWPLRANELPRWIETRMKKHRLQPTRAAIEMIAERVEGNMLAASQEIERLSLLYPKQEIDTAQIIAAVANSARYAVGDCIDAAMQGATARSVMVLHGLKDEGVAPMLLLWALTQEVRSGTRVAQSLAAGMSPQAALKAANVWQNRVQSMQLALSRHVESSWLELLRLTSLADRVVKGHADGDAWEILAEICVRLSGDGTSIMLADEWATA